MSATVEQRRAESERRGLRYTSADGVPDWELPEPKARLWLLSQGDRGAGLAVVFDDDVQRWRRAGVTIVGQLTASSQQSRVVEYPEFRCVDPANVIGSTGNSVFVPRSGPYGSTWMLWRNDSEAPRWYEEGAA
jgi:hypothetical protein